MLIKNPPKIVAEIFVDGRTETDVIGTVTTFRQRFIFDLVDAWFSSHRDQITTTLPPGRYQIIPTDFKMFKREFTFDIKPVA